MSAGLNAGVRRRFADLTCRALQATLPLSMRPWGLAVRHETAAIADDTRALVYAIDSLRGLLPHALAIHMATIFAFFTGGRAPISGGSIAMRLYTYAARRPRVAGIICAVIAVVLGFANMAISGAPARYLAVNGGALLAGMALLLLIERVGHHRRDWSGGLIIAMSAILMGTAVLGHSAGGATRWLMLGGLALQPSLILLPIMVMAFARSSSVLGAAGLIVAAAALALQPDRAMAGTLAAALAVLTFASRDHRAIVALCASVGAFAATLIRADTLPAAPHVDQILYSAFNVHVLAGLAVVVGAFLLLVPAIIGQAHDAENRGIYLVFGALWLAVIMAAALGNYPTPIVGYGGSAIIGYVLSLAALPKRASAPAPAEVPLPDAADAERRDRHLRLGLA